MNRRGRNVNGGSRAAGSRAARSLYPRLSPGNSGLARTSYALVDQLRSIDKRRIRRVFGRVTGDELAAIDQGLELFLGLGGRS
ncbi:MAG: type II toxin-antitoxin system PemK/MazF family toxin [Deltaproteobacteria bacterium]|nr:type II toxin-antitoxin system PemK/MazF family toxin [Deltaproteobacteria bacterium]